MASKLKGSLVLYLNVGNLPAKKCEEFVLNYKTQLEEWITNCKNEGYSFVIVPQRDSDTRIEQIRF